MSAKRVRTTKIVKDGVGLCGDCKNEKPIGQFWKNQLRCKDCARVRHQAWGKQNRGPGKNRWRHIKSLYGVSELAWNELFMAQGRRCAICLGSEPKSPKGWCTDHCHETKLLRGILCHPCNIIVHKHSTPGILRRAAEYLEP